MPWTLSQSKILQAVTWDLALIKKFIDSCYGEKKNVILIVILFLFPNIFHPSHNKRNDFSPIRKHFFFIFFILIRKSLNQKTVAWRKMCIIFSFLLFKMISLWAVNKKEIPFPWAWKRLVGISTWMVCYISTFRAFFFSVYIVIHTRDAG